MSLFSTIRDRPTADLIVLVLALVVAVVVIFCTVFVLVIAVTHPTSNVGEAFKRVVELCNSLIALLVGFVAGRGAGGANGKTEGE
jgi:hypothetical protein